MLSVGCAQLKYIPIETSTLENIVYKDTTIFRDSIVYIPVEKIKEIVPQYDTLHLETSLAVADAYVDSTTNTLRGNIENKKGIEYKYVYKDRLVEIHDTIKVNKPVPYPVEVPKKYVPQIYKYSMGFSIAVILVTLLLGLLKLYFKIK